MKIEDMTPKETSGGYERVFNNKQLGDLITKVQATVIANGAELEKIILTKSNVIDNLDEFIDNVTANKMANGTYLASKKIIKKSAITVRGIEPDIIIFIVEQNRICKIIELKDGFMFDTKKVKGEKENLVTFTEKFGSKIPFVTDYYICCFNETDKEIIKAGMKNRFDIKHILTGKELCKTLNIDYNEIITKRRKDSVQNLEYFISELLKIEEVRNRMKNIFK